MTFKVSFNFFCFRTVLSSTWQTNHIQGDSRDHWQMELQLHDVSKMKHLEDLVPCRSILKGHSLWLLEYIQFQMFRKRPMFYFFSDLWQKSIYSAKNITLSKTRCDFWNSMDVHASTVSTLHLCCISLDRWFSRYFLNHLCCLNEVDMRRFPFSTMINYRAPRGRYYAISQPLQYHMVITLKVSFFTIII